MVEHEPKPVQPAPNEKEIQYENTEPITDRKRVAELLVKSDSEIEVLLSGDVCVNQHSVRGWPEVYEGAKHYRITRAVFDSFLSAGYLVPKVAPGVKNTYQLLFAKARQDETLFPGAALSDPQ